MFAVVSPVRENGSIIGYVYDEVRLTDLYSFIIKERKVCRFPGRDVTIDYTPASCRIRACGLFREVLSNIVEYAIKHSDPAKPLLIKITLARLKDGDRDYCRATTRRAPVSSFLCLPRDDNRPAIIK